MKKVNILQRVVENGVVAVVRADSYGEALKITQACVEGGINAIEITYTIADADALISQLSKMYQGSSTVVIGAGTVLDVATARNAIASGAEFVVSPCFDKEVAELCNLYQIPYMAGCMTINEMVTALKTGVDIIKLFPGNAFGPDFIKAVKAPLPHVSIMPTGGVDLNNVDKWIKNGCVAVGVGGNLVAPAKTGDYHLITKYAKEYVEKVREARGN